MKIQNFEKVAALAGGFISYLLGGFDVLIQTLMMFMLIDIVSGVMKGLNNKKLNSQTMYNGLMKKAGEVVVIIVVNLLSAIVQPLSAARDVVVLLYICNESLSILENVGTFTTLPEFVVDILEQLQDEKNNGRVNEIKRSEKVN